MKPKIINLGLATSLKNDGQEKMGKSEVGLHPIQPDQYRQVNDAKGLYNGKAHIVEMIALLGPPPKELLAKSAAMTEFKWPNSIRNEAASSAGTGESSLMGFFSPMKRVRTIANEHAHRCRDLDSPVAREGVSHQSAKRKGAVAQIVIATYFAATIDRFTKEEWGWREKCRRVVETIWKSIWHSPLYLGVADSASIPRNDVWVFVYTASTDCKCVLERIDCKISQMYDDM
ncbi:hypothetical protein ACO22_00135 [Paracoccidioides brasiliensis]|uniref:Uncharacterized protein n=1 Tax=Paracoccidioides brasiliensis TaxID=121759 RepID=A0A1D2JQD2_PARBR|nr:hypothetical protein ACO22_00135 [Paracoccidioides brasiliensis]